PETRDADFTWKDYQARNNNELASILGNFVNRLMTFLHKNFDGKVPHLSEKYIPLVDYWNTGKMTELELNDKTVIDALKIGVEKVSENYEKFRFRDAITESMNIARAANTYFNDEEPWKSIKADKDQTAKTMFVCCQLVRSLSIVFAPIIPYSAAYIQSLLGEEITIGDDTLLTDIWSSASLALVYQGKEVRQPEIIFGRIEDEFVEAEKAKLGEKNTQNEEEKIAEITFDEFMKVKLKTANVIAAEPIEKSNKLLKLQVQIGEETRQIIAGISQHYTAEEMIG
ncbi:MAG: class I tRNA ligase family protein, partial [Candidatus Kapaibacterium sp.]